MDWSGWAERADSYQLPGWLDGTIPNARAVICAVLLVCLSGYLQALN